MRALGIRRREQAVVLPDNPQIRGMIQMVRYAVTVEEIEE